MRFEFKLFVVIDVAFWENGHSATIVFLHHDMLVCRLDKPICCAGDRSRRYIKASEVVPGMKIWVNVAAQCFIKSGLDVSG